MENAERIRSWLALWDGNIHWLVDALGRKSHSGGVFPRDSRTVQTVHDIVGTARERREDTYVLKLRLAASGESDGVENARKMANLVEFGGCPVFGDNQRVVMRSARLTSSDGSTAIYEAALTVSYEIMHSA